MHPAAPLRPFGCGPNAGGCTHLFWGPLVLALRTVLQARPFPLALPLRAWLASNLPACKCWRGAWHAAQASKQASLNDADVGQGRVLARRSRVINGSWALF